MEFQDVIRKRRMVRSFKDRPIPAAAVDRLLANAVRAPSAGFSQGWAFLVLDTPADTERFWSCTWDTDDARSGFRWQGLFDAPVIIVPMSNKRAYLERYAAPDKGWTDQDESRWPVPFWHIDTGMASMNILLTAVDEGLGALFFGIFAQHNDAFRREFGVPEDYTPIGAIAVGWPAEDEPSPSLKRGRRPHAEVVHRGNFVPPAEPA
ncbi:MAG: nitroreductase family protein [Acidimicrobiales bacterium]